MHHRRTRLNGLGALTELTLLMRAVCLLNRRIQLCNPISVLDLHSKSRVSGPAVSPLQLGLARSLLSCLLPFYAPMMPPDFEVHLFPIQKDLTAVSSSSAG